MCLRVSDKSFMCSFPFMSSHGSPSFHCVSFRVLRASWLSDSRPGWLTRDLVGWLVTCWLTRDRLSDSRPGWLTRDLVGWLVAWLAGSRPVVWLATWLSDARPGCPGCLTRDLVVWLAPPWLADSRLPVGWLAPSCLLTRAFLLADSRLPVGWLRLSDSQPCWLTRSSPSEMWMMYVR